MRLAGEHITLSSMDPSCSVRELWRMLRSRSVAHEVILHHLPRHSQRANFATKSAQIRACARQAEEMYEAASRVSLATRPVLLYYAFGHAAAVICLAKLPDFILSQARGHGLEFIPPSPRGEPLSAACSKTRAGLFDSFARCITHLPMRVRRVEFTRSPELALAPKEFVFSAGLEDEWQRQVANRSAVVSLSYLISRVPELWLGLEAGGVAEVRTCPCELRQEQRGAEYSTLLVLHPRNEDGFGACERMVDAFLDPAQWTAERRGNALCLRSHPSSTGALAWDTALEVVQDASGDTYVVLYDETDVRIPQAFRSFMAGFILSGLARYHPEAWQTAWTSRTEEMVLYDQALGAMASSFFHVAVEQVYDMGLSFRAPWTPRTPWG